MAARDYLCIARDTNDDHRFLELLAKYDGQGRRWAKVAANNYAPRVFAAEKNGMSLKRFEQAMERLFEAKKIHAQSYGPRPNNGRASCSAHSRPAMRAETSTEIWSQMSHGQSKLVSLEGNRKKSLRRETKNSGLWAARGKQSTAARQAVGLFYVGLKEQPDDTKEPFCLFWVVPRSRMPSESLWGIKLIFLRYYGCAPHLFESIDRSGISERIMSDDFDRLDVTETARTEAALNRCRALATKIGNELRNKRPEHFVDNLSLADIHSSLERAADVLSTVKGSPRRGRQLRR
jgi:hypothetical protein